MTYDTSFEYRVDQRFQAMFAKFTDLDEMTVDMLRTYCITCVQIDELNDMIQDEGYFLIDPKGKLIEHPAVNTMHKLNADKARYFAPLKRHLNKQADQTNEDELDSFLGL